MNIAITTIAAMLACCSVPSTGFARCTGPDFGRTAKLACNRTAEDCLLQRKYIPVEIRDIEKGAAMTWAGFISHGPATYIALDISNQRALDIQIYCLTDAVPPQPLPPKIKSPTSYNFEKAAPGWDGHDCIEHVRIIPLSSRQTSDLVCPLNSLWSKSFRPYERTATDMETTVWLLLPHKAREGMALGYFTGPVGDFGKALLKLFADAPSSADTGTHPAVSQ